MARGIDSKEFRKRNAHSLARSLARCSLPSSLSLRFSLFASLSVSYIVHGSVSHSLADSGAHSFLQFHIWPSPYEQQGGGEVLELDAHVLAIDSTPHPSSTSFRGCKAPVTPHIQSHDQSCTERVGCERDRVSESAATSTRSHPCATHLKNNPPLSPPPIHTS